MKTILYLDGKRATKKTVLSLISEVCLERLVKDAKESHAEDPMTQNDYYIGKMLTIEFN